MSQLSNSTHTSNSQGESLPGQPVEQTRNYSNASEDQGLAGDEDVDGQLTLRALVSTKEAGVIIGKGGKNVAELRDATEVKAGVSKVVQAVHDRVLTVTGSLEGVAKAYSFIAQTLLDNPVGNTTPPTSPGAGTTTTSGGREDSVTLRLLISHNLMGTVIGRQGAKIKHIQDTSGVRMTASKSLLPQSTERVVEVRGTVSALQLAVQEIGQCLLEDKERAYGTILYNPSKVNVSTTTGNPAASATATSSSASAPSHHRRSSSITRTGNGSDFATSSGSPNAQARRTSQSFLNNPNIRTQNISIPSDMVGCIIGKGGAKISEIRRLSGSRISIAKMPHDESGERLFSIEGTQESNERALYLLYGQLENEKERRLRGVMNQDDDLLVEEE
ncbi:hypothetical protein BDB00DRAFT_883021 [Zychaea mexicana]|uniref:uncharacterized protein n=1 Tax=Zychaea mexicana TaxID=64656 RepID=UPI0022FF3FB0|nr:uncharacterized protein BDB00DRAFT_883021 [Zychaea mexicana]KAI9493658.1 hypothetical protein BDB00DRAFT_883021 [Zychaea mexicana]